LAARVERTTTTVVTKRVPPIMILIDLVKSYTCPVWLPVAANEVNKSAAPFPNAKNVTPASDCGILKCVVIKSKLGLKYSSAVVCSTNIA